MINDIRVKVDFLVIFVCSCLLVPSVHLPELSKTVASTTVNSALSVRSVDGNLLSIRTRKWLIQQSGHWLTACCWNTIPWLALPVQLTCLSNGYKPTSMRNMLGCHVKSKWHPKKGEANNERVMSWGSLSITRETNSGSGWPSMQTPARLWVFTWEAGMKSQPATCGNRYHLSTANAQLHTRTFGQRMGLFYRPNDRKAVGKETGSHQLPKSASTIRWGNSCLG